CLRCSLVLSGVFRGGGEMRGGGVLGGVGVWCVCWGVLCGVQEGRARGRWHWGAAAGLSCVLGGLQRRLGGVLGMRAPPTRRGVGGGGGYQSVTSIAWSGASALQHGQRA